MRASSLSIIALVVFGISLVLWSVAAEAPKTVSITLPELNVPLAPAAKLFPVTIKQPAGPPRVHTGEIDHQGKPVTIACSTCHSTRTPNLKNSTGADLDLFHQGLNVHHGANACLSCHDAGNYDRLHLADGSPVEFVDVVQLCAQCHGTQYRSYQHGAHGGMTGYWDLTRGPRQRNSCTSCHDPHAPKYQGALPMPPPKDRFQIPHVKGAHHE